MGCAVRKAISNTEQALETKKLSRKDSVMLQFASVYDIPVRDTNGKFLGNLGRALSEKTDSEGPFSILIMNIDCNDEFANINFKQLGELHQ